MRRRTLLAALALPTLALPAVAQAQEPKQIRLVVPFPPGATNDNVARALSRALAPRLGATVVIDNRAGAGDAVGAPHVAGSRADGSTLLNASAGNLVIAPHLGPVGYDPLKDFAPVGCSGEAHSLLATNPGLPATDVATFIAHARRHPGRLNCASASIGSVRALGVSTFLIRGFDPLDDAIAYGRELLPAVRARDAARGLAAE